MLESEDHDGKTKLAACDGAGVSLRVVLLKSRKMVDPSACSIPYTKCWPSGDAVVYADGVTIFMASATANVFLVAGSGGGSPAGAAEAVAAMTTAMQEKVQQRL
jgi:hypothetical protein